MAKRPGTTVICAALVLATGCSSIIAPFRRGPTGVDTMPPPVTREMRGVWIATVSNIDWPSKNTLSADQQRSELIDLLDRATARGFNAVVFQIRPAGDAVYQSSLEPWAALLTGVQGTDPGYDPLAFAVREAHARGLELHAWINPFRAGKSSDTANFAPTHVFNTRRDLVRIYGTQAWVDPGEPDVQDRAMAVVRDIVQRYDIDAIHADDYFYPYQEQDSSGRVIAFPDSATYVRSGSTLPVDDWRRANIDRFVERLYREVHGVKPTVKVGLSPFGIWRPGNPPSVAGLDAFATIYADSRKWLTSGWVDYLAPQLYWAISAPQQSYPALLDWWLGENSLGRNVWPGLAAYRVNNGTPRALPVNEIAEQVTLTRARPTGTGHILYNANGTLKRDAGAVAASLSKLYAQRALVPASAWLDSTPPPVPIVTVSGRTIQIVPGAGEAARWWYVRAWTSRGWTTRVLFGTTLALKLDRNPTRVLVNAVDQAGNSSAATEWRRDGVTPGP